MSDAFATNAFETNALESVARESNAPIAANRINRSPEYGD